ncbi:MAG: sugar phosphate isomerase/epimerase family protein [Verrucomicrobiota bacterium]
MKFPANFTIISDEVSQDLPDIVRFVKEFNLPGIELRSMFGRAFKDLTPADIAEIKRTAQGEGWKIFGCASPVFKCDIDDAAAIRAHIDEFKRSLGVAHELGASIVRVFTFLRRSPAENTKALPRIATHLEELRAAAGDSKVTIGIENEASCMIGTAAESAAILRALPDQQFGIVWDPCNVIYVPDTIIEATADFSTIVDRIAHIHVKDAVRVTPKPGGLPGVAKPVGVGDVGWRKHLTEIAATGYKGMFSLETHWRVIQIAEKDLHLPAGYGFSRGGEEASRVCLHNLRELLPA